MIRVCDGGDPELIRHDPPWEPGDDPVAVPYPRAAQARRCRCGLAFDDRERYVVYPHPVALAATLGDRPAVSLPGPVVPLGGWR